MIDLISLIDIAELGRKATAFIPSLIAAAALSLFFLVVGFVVIRALRVVIRRGDMPAAAERLLLRVTRYTIGAIAVLTIASQLGLNVGALVAGLGVAGLAVSFAAQDTIQNLISGVAIFIDRPFKEGDWIAIGDMHATVTEIRLRTTVLTTFDNETVVVPNKTLVQERVVNYTLTPRIRIKLPVRVALNEDPVRVRDLLLAAVRDDARVLADPAPVVIVASIGESALNVELRFWTQDPLLKFPLQWEYAETCKRALESAGVEIPVPRLRVDASGRGADA